MYSVLFAFTWRLRPPAACCLPYCTDLAWAGVFARSTRSSTQSAPVIVSTGYRLLLVYHQLNNGSIFFSLLFYAVESNSYLSCKRKPLSSQKNVLLPVRPNSWRKRTTVAVSIWRPQCILICVLSSKRDAPVLKNLPLDVNIGKNYWRYIFFTPPTKKYRNKKQKQNSQTLI